MDVSRRRSRHTSLAIAFASTFWIHHRRPTSSTTSVGKSLVWLPRGGNNCNNNNILSGLPFCSSQRSLWHATATATSIALSSSSSSISGGNSQEGKNSLASSSSSTKKSAKKKKLWTVLWIHVLSLWIVYNYVFSKNMVWPQFLQTFGAIKLWNVVHAVSGMLFSGGIITTTLLEWQLLKQQQQEDSQKRKKEETSSLLSLFQVLFSVESRMVLPALTGSMISGVVQSFFNYGTLGRAPKHVKSALHTLFLFGLWWGVADRRSQSELLQQLQIAASKKNDNTNNEKSTTTTEKQDPSPLVKILLRRRWYNAISCGFCILLYAIMVVKPGFTE